MNINNNFPMIIYSQKKIDSKRTKTIITGNMNSFFVCFVLFLFVANVMMTIAQNNDNDNLLFYSI